MSVNALVNADLFNVVFRKQMKMGIYNETLAGTKTLTDAYPPVVMLDPGGSGRTVLLPAEADSEGLTFWIVNLADNPEALTVKEDSNTTTIITLLENQRGMVFCDGTTWRGWVSFDGVTASQAELNILDGVTAAAAELNYLDLTGLGTGVASEAVVLDSGEDFIWPSGGVLTYGVLKDPAGTTLLATALEMNRVLDVSGRLVAAGATLSITEALHDGKTVLFDTASGTTLTLPAATGSGMKIRCVVSVSASTNSHSVACVGTDDMLGTLMSVDTDTSDATLAWAAVIGDTFDTITWDRSTKGSALIGDWVEFEDVASGVWAVVGGFRSSGTVVTPFSSAVS